MDDNDFKLIKDSGCKLLRIGIESGSYKIRKHIGKNFTNETIFEVLDKIKKYKINCELFFIAGYPTETKNDVIQTKNLLYEFYKKQYQNIISNIRVQPMEIQTNILDNLKSSDSYIKRYDRYFEIREYILSLGFTIKTDKRMINWVNEKLKETKKITLNK
jgi:radical SAM superfamily enzyme YgiQ (UPF0313 family)